MKSPLAKYFSILARCLAGQVYGTLYYLLFSLQLFRTLLEQLPLKSRKKIRNRLISVKKSTPTLRPTC